MECGVIHIVQIGIIAHPHRPEIVVLRLVELVKAHAGVGRVDLQVERRRLDRLLLLAGQAMRNSMVSIRQLLDSTILSVSSHRPE